MKEEGRSLQVTSPLSWYFIIDLHYLQVGDSGPALVMLSNSSKLASDVKKDVEKAGVKGVNDGLTHLMGVNY